MKLLKTIAQSILRLAVVLAAGGLTSAPSTSWGGIIYGQQSTRSETQTLDWDNRPAFDFAPWSQIFSHSFDNIPPFGEYRAASVSHQATFDELSVTTSASVSAEFTAPSEFRGVVYATARTMFDFQVSESYKVILSGDVTLTDLFTSQPVVTAAILQAGRGYRFHAQAQADIFSGAQPISATVSDTMDASMFLQPVPEPNSLALAASAATAVIVVVGRRRSKARLVLQG